MHRLALALALLTPALAQDPGAPGPDAQPRRGRPEQPAQNLSFLLVSQQLTQEADGLMVTGGATGFAAQPGRFYTLAHNLIDVASAEELTTLVDHEHVIVRLAALYALAHVEPHAAVAPLRARLDSDVDVDLLRSGCCVESSTEGAVAQLFLDNANALEPFAEPRPLVPQGR